jgi:hypothetical protein
VPDPPFTSLSIGFRSAVFSGAGFSLRGDNCVRPDCFVTAAAFVDYFGCDLLGLLGTSVAVGVAVLGVTFDFAAAGATGT